MVVHLHGKIEEKLVLKGTGSEHVGIVLIADDGMSYRLRLKGHNPFDRKPFKPFVGRMVTIQAEVVSHNYLQISSISNITPDKGGPSVDPKNPRRGGPAP